MKILTLIILITSVLIFAVEGRSSEDSDKHDTIIVQGIGYPPIKAQSMTQARLMATRAAVIDAYRNAIVTAGARDYDENNFYIGLSGFVRGMTILEEEYLKDGGIRILARVPAENVSITSTTVIKTNKESGSPSRVSLDEWYRIITPLVKIHPVP